MGSIGPVTADTNDAISRRQTASTMAVDNAIDSSPVATRSVNNALNSINLRTDPDAQATVTDFLDFTEYLPSDMTRSLTLIGKLDQTYVDASTSVHELTKKWGRLPLLPLEERPSAVQLRADISENLSSAVSARIYSHAEASRMADNVNQHYNRAQSILSKLKIMLENWPPPDEQKSPVATRSPQLSRTPKVALRVDGQRVRRQQIPRITVPGEVLAPYEINYEAFSDSSESGGEEEADQGSPVPLAVAPGPQPRIKVVRKEKPPKPPRVPKTPKQKPSVALPGANPAGVVLPTLPGPPPLSTSLALARLQPPPENAVKGSADAPWLRLTNYELAKLRKRMKKNAAWAPSDTMIARELKNLGRGVEAYQAAKQKAEEEGVPFEDHIPSPVVESELGTEAMPPATLNQEALAPSEEKSLHTPRQRPSVAKKAKGDQLAKLAAEEAEESARKMREYAREFMSGPSQPPSQPDGSSQAKAELKKTRQKKRKRDSEPEAEAEKPDFLEVPGQRPQSKRTKTETPVPPPQRLSSTSSQHVQETPIHPPHITPSGVAIAPRTTPVPVQVPVQGQDQPAKVQPASSPESGINTAVSIAVLPVMPRNETPIPAPVPSEKKANTPILPPVRETRKSQAARKQEEQQQQQRAVTPAAVPFAKPSSRGSTPFRITGPAFELEASLTMPAITAPVPRRPASGSQERRPASRGKAASQELEQPSLATDRPRRASTARNTPAPEKEPARPASRRSKRPAPGVISRTNSGGNSAVGKRKAAPKKKSAAARGAASTKKDKAGHADGVVPGGAVTGAEGEVEIDDEGNVIDPNETRYCLCNGVSFGTMIQCDNADNCKQEWFHLECVGLSDVPARTTKWYCPDCRKLLNIGEKGEVNARGVRT